MDKNEESAANRNPEQQISRQPDREGAEAPQGSPEPQLPPAPQPPTEDLPPPPEPTSVAKDLLEAPQVPPPQELSSPPKVPDEELPPAPQVPRADLSAAPSAPNNTAEELPGVVFPDGDEKQEKERSRGMSGSGSEPRDEDRPRVRRTDASERRSRADSPSHDERYEDVRFERESQFGGSSGSATRSPRRGQQNDDEGGQSSGLYGSKLDSSNLMGSAVAELIGTFILIYTGCAVAVAAILQRPTAGPGIYDSLAVALAFGLWRSWSSSPP